MAAGTQSPCCPSPVEPIRASPVGGLSRIGRYAKTVDCGREGSVETAGPVDEALIGSTGRLSRSGNYAKTIDHGSEGQQRAMWISVSLSRQSKPCPPGRLSLLGNYGKSIDRGREGTVET